MNIDTLTNFFMWCTIINFALMIFWFILCASAPDLVYRTQRRWFPLSREAFTVVIYCFLAAYKIFFIMFNLVPYIALLLVG